jgi:septal ring factor EnvC (AmiA/AmiB activator)
MQNKNGYFSIIMLGVLLISQASYAESYTDKQLELTALNEQIKDLKENIGENKEELSVVQQELARYDIAIGKHAKEVSQLGESLSQEQQRLAQLHSSQRQLQQQLESQKKVLSAQLQAAYRLGRHEYLTLLLTQEDPTALDRVLNYLGYLNTARHEVIIKLKQNLHEYAAIESSIQEKTNSVVALKDNANKQQQMLLLSKSARESVLKKLEDKLSTQASKLSELQSNRQLLEGVITKLQIQNRNLPTNDIPFSKWQGRLPWPIEGKLASRFSTEEDGDNHSTGIVIAAAQGQPVRALYSGKVIFADWLTGYGLLIIVQHDNHYMSLYGRNQSLYKKEGETVNAGEMLSTIGNSGGYSGSGLYFEIRHDGHPVNPEFWLRRMG